MCAHKDPVQSLRTFSSVARPSRILNRLARAAVLLASMACALWTPAFAQQGATISGMLADSSGAGVPGASLTLTNQDTGVALVTVKSESDGSFSFQQVPAPGSYTISVQVSGFSRLQQKDIVVTEGERRSVGNLTLQVGSLSDQITVQADITPVQTESAERSADMDKHEIEAQLARGLNYVSLLRALPELLEAMTPTVPAATRLHFRPSTERADPTPFRAWMA
jgi:hypothetical protein